jgi:hypothetical protein
LIIQPSHDVTSAKGSEDDQLIISNNSKVQATDEI